MTSSRRRFLRAVYDEAEAETITVELRRKGVHADVVQLPRKATPSSPPADEA